MQVIKGSRILVVDCDSTILEWRPTPEQIKEKGIYYTDKNGVEHVYVPIEGNIKQLKEHKSRLHTVIVWSAAGYEFAELAVKLLKLEAYVDLVMGKPTWCLDDLPPEEYMPKSQWFKD